MAVPPRREEDRIVISRVYPVAIERTWEALTVSEKTAPWFGPFTGDPASGAVQVVMVAEESTDPVTINIDACVPNERLALSSPGEGGIVLDLTLSSVSDGTRLELAYEIGNPEEAGAYGAGWEFYLDRLGASLTGADVEAVDFNAYYPKLEQKYLHLAE